MAGHFKTIPFTPSLGLATFFEENVMKLDGYKTIIGLILMNVGQALPGEYAEWGPVVIGIGSVLAGVGLGHKGLKAINTPK